MKKAIFSVLCFYFGFYTFSQDILLKYKGSGNYSYIERTDARRYDNGKYVGLVSREVRSFIAQTSVPYGGDFTDRYYDGSFFIDETTKRNSTEINTGINGAVPSSFKISSDGKLTMQIDNGYPTFRSFPAFTDKKINKGDKWQAKAERTVDPLNKGIFTKMPILVEYTYLRDEKFNGEDVYVLSAQWATRYGISYHDFSGDKDLKSAHGSHKATMYISRKTGNALVVRDMMEETFIYNDGNQYTFKGTISMFTEYPPAYDKSRLFPALQRIASVSAEELKDIMEHPVEENSGALNKDSFSDRNGAESSDKLKENNSASFSDDFKEPEDSLADENSGMQNISEKNKTKENVDSKILSSVDASEKIDKTSSSKKDVIVENTSAGIRLTMQNLNFKPDSAELLPGEKDRLDRIALLLKEVPDRMFLVEGHTANVGYEKGEMKLSIERADAVALALIERGVPREKFICKGSGGTKPIADNSTSAGKARNRRVEITILE